ncbi:WhiB family transcriptional regulator [Amycolatopsis thermophila]|uniref:Transcriptional regulator WhiB n=1 Tax=Amycolatopsis thermophila TaxID=206084 RepID=A0ABU0ENE9_9PSEU|nr:WhiB family transcriptional regulator [Amycolatopsis thermophila]MDQ0376525.1 WhiB family redox-sensing transcriptional regulator [Amycolatopsis thermophila]
MSADWKTRAVCRAEDPETFFPVGEPGTPGYDRQAARAKAVCHHCPVQAECLAYGMSDDNGIYGGTTPAERRSARRQAASRNLTPV